MKAVLCWDKESLERVLICLQLQFFEKNKAKEKHWQFVNCCLQVDLTKKNRRVIYQHCLSSETKNVTLSEFRQCKPINCLVISRVHFIVIV